jgi:hypothetical protein
MKRNVFLFFFEKHPIEEETRGTVQKKWAKWGKEEEI